MYHEIFLESRKVPSAVCGDAERVALKFLIHLDEIKGSREFLDKTPPFKDADATEETMDAEGGGMRAGLVSLIPVVVESERGNKFIKT